jgi:hypothetical protein
MQVRMLIAILLLFSCIMFVPAIVAAFPTAQNNPGVESVLKSVPIAQIAGSIHPNDPGSGGGGAGVIC